MVGKAVTRAFLILALIVTAHAIKPFSIKSVTRHLLYSTRSFKFVLPDRLRDNFDHANYLAINLSDSLFENGDSIRHFAKDTAPDFGLVAIKAQFLDEVNKSATKQKLCPKKLAPAKRVIKTGKSGASGLIASVNANEIAPIELPPASGIAATHVLAPAVQPCVTKLFPVRVIAIDRTRPVGLMVALRKSDCEEPEAVRGALIALIEEANGVKLAFRGVEKFGIARVAKAERSDLIASECETQDTEVAAEELEIEIAEPKGEVTAPQTNEEFRPGPLFNLFEKCSKDL